MKLPRIDGVKNVKSEIRVFGLISLCFFLTSTAYLSWLYHLMTLTSPQAADALTMVAGYACQALGLFLIAFLIHARQNTVTPTMYRLFLLLHACAMIPALLSGSFWGTLIFGLIMNTACGMIAAFYLQELALYGSNAHRALTFGAGYCAASVTSWLLSIAGIGSERTGFSLILCLVLSAACGILAAPAHDTAVKADDSAEDPVPAGRSFNQASSDTGNALTGIARPRSSENSQESVRKLLLCACLTVFLASLVKNMGFSFPSADLALGLSLELSRTFYAAGLVIAGFVSDKSRRYGAACAFASLAIPFIMLALTGEPVSGMIFWCLDYFVYAFLSVYRVIVFSDIAADRKLLFLSGLGLMFGRLGDAAGTGLHMLLPDRVSVLVLVTAVLFVPAVFSFFGLYQRLYMPAVVQRRSEREVFERFALTHDLTPRERSILQMILDNHSNAQIGEKLYVTESTVKYHIHNLLKKTGCKNRRELTELYTRGREET